ncbi:MAG TPA: hypothetical protein VJB17_02460 [Patescibacteria group bacterium]|nr:hypothetical protein [Patescibacteria group bacterium]
MGTPRKKRQYGQGVHANDGMAPKEIKTREEYMAWLIKNGHTEENASRLAAQWNPR